MKRSTFLRVTSVIVLSIGGFAMIAPGDFIANVKYADPSETANVMMRTVGILLLTIGVLNFLVRNHADSPTLRAVLIANLFLQIGIMPIDPAAYAAGVYRTLGSFAPNTLLHIALACGFGFYIVRMKRDPSRIGMNERLSA